MSKFYKYVGTKWSRVSPDQVKANDYYEIYSDSGEYLQCGLFSDFCYSKSDGKWYRIEWEDGSVHDADSPGSLHGVVDDVVYDSGHMLIVSEAEFEFLKRIVP